MGQLADALFNKTQQNVLGLLYTHPEKSFYTKQILRITGMGVATIRRELERMAATGIISRKKIGNQLHYQANPDCPIYLELLGITRKTFGIADVLRQALEPCRASISFAFVYGSMATRTDTAESDIDLMVIGEDLDYMDLMEVLSPLEERLGRRVNPTIYSLQDFKMMLEEKNDFLLRVMGREKVPIMGSEDDIRKP